MAKIKAVLALLFIIVLAAWMTSAYVYHVRIFDEAHNKTTVAVKKGDRFKIILTANPSTGYSWSINNMDNQYLGIISSGYEPDKKGIIGSGGKKYWEIKALKAGTTEAVLSYYRAWEKAPPARIFRLRFNILL